MAHTITSRRVARRLLIAVTIGGTIAAGVAQYASRSSTVPPTASSAEEERSTPDQPRPRPLSSTVDAIVVGAAGSSVSARTSARAEGVAIIGADRLAARPTVSTTSGTRLASEPTVQTRGDLVTATGLTLAAAVTDGHSSAHAFVRNVRYGRHDLGPLAVHCRDGVPEAKRAEIVHLTRNIQVQYGHARGNRVTGATVLVLGPGDRVIRVVTIATVTCTTASATQNSAPDPAQPPPPAAETPPPTPQATAPDGAGTPQRRLIPRAPARPAHLGHRLVTK